MCSLFNKKAACKLISTTALKKENEQGQRLVNGKLAKQLFRTAGVYEQEDYCKSNFRSSPKDQVVMTV